MYNMLSKALSVKLYSINTRLLSSYFGSILSFVALNQETDSLLTARFLFEMLIANGFSVEYLCVSIVLFQTSIGEIVP